MNKFRWGGVATKGVYLDETVMRMCYTHRREMAQLAMNLILEGKRDKALKVLQKAEKELQPITYHSHSLILKVVRSSLMLTQC